MNGSNKQNNGHHSVYQNQMILQRKLSERKLDDPIQTRQDFGILMTSLREISVNQNNIQFGKKERIWIKEYYDNPSTSKEYQNMQHDLRQSEAKDKIAVKQINDHMMKINNLCKEYNAPAMFLSAKPDYSDEEIIKEANEYIRDTDAINDLNYQSQNTGASLLPSQLRQRPYPDHRDSQNRPIPDIPANVETTINEINSEINY